MLTEKEKEDVVKTWKEFSRIDSFICKNTNGKKEIDDDKYHVLSVDLITFAIIAIEQKNKGIKC